MMIVGVLVLLVAHQVAGHSWLVCSDYQPADRSLRAAAIRNFDSGVCKSYSRGYTNQAGTIFGEDRGFDRQASGNTPSCNVGFSARAYSDRHPMASYRPGQRVRLVWPSKNHDAESCTNPFIPDTSMKIFMICGADRERYASSGYNPPISEFAQDRYLVADLKKLTVPDYAASNPSEWDPGFQNCPFFCDNTDKAVCFQEINVPSSASGTCTFLWYWMYV